MKTAVSVPDEIFQQAEKLAKRLRTSRSQLYSSALREYLARHTDDDITAAINAVCDEVGETACDPFVAAAARATLRRVEW